MDFDELLSVLHCDSSNVSLTWERCQGASTCIQHIAITGTLGELDHYAQCESVGAG
jgi:hypothetical protein